ncbi:GGDEF domain-containing protein [Pseudosporangium ferrugineum]|uniref:Diguanylate cyclase (GGDEF)-like protein n=1 Tax=Pseudosporangium ferrugineum TaxID=439699 RepID=A0A2T0SD41_9ACTN|nr:GGDEF domain-containing protein [Pseudosporangium ferrugineum]PRY31337.1 diguanylate cyclase (GGDEF)-like protein [Pseudosporangium ferrugineum]
MARRWEARSPRRADPLVAALVVLIALVLAVFGAQLLPVTVLVPAFWLLMIVVQVSFARSCRRVARFLGRAAPGREAVRARAGAVMWRFFAVAGAVFVLGNLVQLAVAVRDPLSADAAVGTDAQVASIALGAVLIVAGMLRYPRGDMGAAERFRLRIDVATVMAAAVTFGLWVAEVPPGPHDASWAAETVVGLLVQPGLFLVVLFAVVRVILGGGPFTRVAGLISGVAAALQAALQAVPASEYVRPPGMAWLLAGNVLVSGLIAIGARVQERDVLAGSPRAARRPKRPYSMLPYGAMIAVWALAVGVLAADGRTGRGWVVGVGAMVTTALVVGRQVAAFRHIAELLREREELTAQLTELAFHDALTKLANRGLSMQRLEEALGAGPATVFLVDLDEFKPVNDAYGHAAGDRLLIEVGRRLRGCVRDGDTVARLDGDEFAVLVEGLSADRRADLADGLDRALSGSVRIGTAEVPVRASIGVATGRPGTHDPDSLLHEADMAMYARKVRRRHLQDSDLP